MREVSLKVNFSFFLELERTQLISNFNLAALQADNR